MRIVVTGSAGHLGEALVRVLRGAGEDVLGVDVLASPFTDAVGSIVDRAFVRRCLEGAEGVLHAATLHKPHVGSHAKQDFVDVNVTGTLNLLEEAVAAGVQSFVFTSSTTTFGRALSPPPGAPAAWITEAVPPVAKNVYGATKVAAEDLCALLAHEHGLPVVVLRTSRFFPEGDDVQTGWDGENLKVNELLYRRADIADVVDAHRLALGRAPGLGFDRFVISGTTPFTRDDLPQLRVDAPGVLARHVPDYVEIYEELGWRMLEEIERVYVNAHAREVLGWRPKYDFPAVLARLADGEDWRSPLTHAIGRKGYHAESTGVYTQR